MAHTLNQETKIHSTNKPPENHRGLEPKVGGAIVCGVLLWCWCLRSGAGGCCAVPCCALWTESLRDGGRQGVRH
eukprot:8601543-Lingulodinium_polyedra.AAC.1